MDENTLNHKVESLLGEMTLAERASLLAGADMWRTVAVPRLGIPAVQVTDGPNGARGADDNLGSTSVCLPVGIALGATWNPELLEEVGGLLAAEARAKGAHVLLAPTVNIQRTPLAGRNFECYAEDPFLSGTMAAAYIRGLQQNGVAACIKHFVANDQEYERFSISAEVAERPLREIYLEPFRVAIEASQPWSLMSAYNRINGVYASENDLLLRRILKEEWGWEGAVISDWYGTYSEEVKAGGLDLEMPGPGRWHAAEKIVDAVTGGDLDEAVVDDKVRRLLRLLGRVGLLDGTSVPVRPVDTPADRALARRAAAEGIVLLKNEGEVLPLAPEQVQTIAVIGENAHWAQIMGGGSAQVNPHYAVSPLAGIEERAAAAGIDVAYEIGALVHRMPPLLEKGWLTAADGQSAGLTLEYFHNLNLAGDPVHAEVALKSQLTWFGTVNPFVDPRHFSLRLRGTLDVPADGIYQLHLYTIGRARLFVDGELLVDHWEELDEGVAERNRRTIVPLDLKAGRPVSLLVEYVTDPHSRWRTLRLGCIVPLPEDPLQAAVDLAARSDVAVVVAGLTHEWESEGFDRADMGLPGRQDELIARVAAANPRTVVVLNAGAPLAMPWVGDVPAVVEMWYGGQEMGRALADVLFGDVNPSGKLPVTFPRRLADNPAFINYPGENGRVHYGEGLFVGYRYYDKKEIEPLFPFGHGLSYTTFALDNLRLNDEVFGPDKPIEVEVDVTNTGPRAGQEVVQLYLSDVAARVARPIRELKAFAKVELAPGETGTVTFRLEGRDLAFYDPAAAGWATESGEFEICVGSSSRDLPLSTRFSWRGAAETEASDMEQLSTVPT